MEDKQLEEALARLDEAMNQLARRIKMDMKESFTLPPMQLILLHLLERSGAQRMTALAEQLGVTQGGCTALIDRAMEGGLVQRARDPDDRRVVWVTLTDKGNQTLQELCRTRAAILARYFSRLAPEEIETLAGLVSRASAALAAEEQLAGLSSTN
jgi:DNA-binding MarR family transcriptional regulator